MDTGKAQLDFSDLTVIESETNDEKNNENISGSISSVNELAMAAKNSEKDLELLISQNTDFILRTASNTVRFYMDKSSEEWSVALLAFVEAVNAYSTDKGNFYSFSAMVIKRRLTDNLRKQFRRSAEISVSPSAFSGEREDEEAVDKALESQIIKKITVTPDNDIQYEIQSLSQALEKYDIGFMELTESSPKAGKTKAACARAIVTVIKNQDIIRHIKKTGTLPIKTLEKEYKLHRKILERHRKYIIAAVEIITGDYPYLSEYVRYIKDYM